ncbi:MAG: glutamine--fructose-6-phosphate transaminase (isomerizing), partial [Gammaproteobacteria bacterium]
MCGIVGAIVRGGAREFLLRGLAALEYRGYDSTGLAFAGDDAVLRIATTGRTETLRRLAADAAGDAGIGHTRWATHGAPTEQNAHPVVAGKVAVVHNGIIENHAALRAELAAAGRVFHTETDTEVIAHLLDAALSEGDELPSAMRRTAARLEGAFAVAATAAGRNEIVFARHGAPLMAGEGADGVYLASDAQALESAADRVMYLEDGDCGTLSADGVQIADSRGAKAERARHPPPAGAAIAALGEYRHFMHKEIFEQPFAAAAAARPFAGGGEISPEQFGAGAEEAFRRADNILIVACGTSYHAGMIACYWMRELGVPCRAEIASEYRYRPDARAGNALAVAVSQSGETADTLSALRAAKKAGAKTLSLVNAPASAMARESDFVMPAYAGPEIGVASTKCFTAQLAQLLALSLAAAKAKQILPPQTESAALSQLRALPRKIRRALLLEKQLRVWARSFAAAKSALYVGRGAHYPLALEGALKLKEISYLHAEGCAAGELKHGTLALVDDSVPVVGLAPANSLSAKTESNLAEVAARNGRLFILSGGGATPAGAQTLAVEDGGEWISPMVYAAPLQLLAYHTALEKGTDIDKPRNLAKSVTV